MDTLEHLIAEQKKDDTSIIKPEVINPTTGKVDLRTRIVGADTMSYKQLRHMLIIHLKGLGVTIPTLCRVFRLKQSAITHIN